MSGSFQVLKMTERLLETSEPSPYEAIEGLADRIWKRGWR
jgi:hypothetical protein